MLGAYGHKRMTGVLLQRIEHRATAGRRLWNKIKIGLTSALSVVSVALTLGSASPLAVALISLTVASIATVDGAVRGDWIDFATGIVSFAGSVASIAGQIGTLAAETAKGIQHAVNVANTSVRTAGAFLEGDNILGALSAVSGTFSILAEGGLMDAASAISDPVGRGIATGLFTTLQTVPERLYGGILALERGDWLGGITGLFDTAVGISEGLTVSAANVLSEGLNDKDKKALRKKIATKVETIDIAENVGKTGLIITQAAKTGSLVNLTVLADIWQPQLKKAVEESKKQQRLAAYKQQTQVTAEDVEDAPLVAESAKLDNGLDSDDPLAGIDLETGEAEPLDIGGAQTDKKSGAEPGLALDELDSSWDSDDPLAGINLETLEPEPLLIPDAPSGLGDSDFDNSKAANDAIFYDFEDEHVYGDKPASPQITSLSTPQASANNDNVTYYDFEDEQVYGEITDFQGTISAHQPDVPYLHQSPGFVEYFWGKLTPGEVDPLGQDNIVEQIAKKVTRHVSKKAIKFGSKIASAMVDIAKFYYWEGIHNPQTLAKFTGDSLGYADGIARWATGEPQSALHIIPKDMEMARFNGNKRSIEGYKMGTWRASMLLSDLNDAQRQLFRDDLMNNHSKQQDERASIREYILSQIRQETKSAAESVDRESIRETKEAVPQD